MTSRYAIYYAPSQQDPLWAAACAWLGRSPVAGEQIAQYELPDMVDRDAFAKATESARRYGFHATLKAPMRLQPARAFDDLMDALQDFAARTPPAPIGRLELRNLDGFIALMPQTQGMPVTQLAADCVSKFEPFRAPLTDAEYDKRIVSGLTSNQKQLLDQYGYPYVMDEFRMHLTLSDRLDGSMLEMMMGMAEDWFGPTLERTYNLDQIAIYEEAEPGAAFQRIADFELTGTSKDQGK
jgi:putative phosphonate metabolism protein